MSIIYEFVLSHLIYQCVSGHCSHQLYEEELQGCGFYIITLT